MCELLVARGDRVHVFDDLSRGSADWLPPEVELHRGDIRDAALVCRAFEAIGPGAVVHLAAMHFIPAVDGAPNTTEEINVGGTRNVVSAARATPPKVFVFASSAAVYPDSAEPIAESVEPAPIDLYGRTKLEGERLVAELAGDDGLACVSARLFNVVGPRETNPHIVPEIVQQVRAGVDELVLGNLEPRRDYVDVRDVAAALAALADAARPGLGVFNVGTGVSVSVADLVRMCSRIVDRPLIVRPDPARLREIDRTSLVADPTMMRSHVRWEVRRTLMQTLRELVVDVDMPKKAAVAR